MKSFVAACCTACLLVLAGVAPAAHAADNRVVIQVSDNDEGRWNLALNNARNLKTALGKDKVDIEIVAFGPGIAMLKGESTVGNRVIDAGADGIKVIACENTMKAQKLTRDDMLGSIGYVPAGVVRLMERQQQGWAYLRP